MKTFIAKGINWDCDQETAEIHELPEDVEIDVLEGGDVFDALSDKYGFCINYIESIEEK